MTNRQHLRLQVCSLKLPFRHGEYARRGGKHPVNCVDWTQATAASPRGRGAQARSPRSVLTLAFTTWRFGLGVANGDRRMWGWQSEVPAADLALRAWRPEFPIPDCPLWSSPIPTQGGPSRMGKPRLAIPWADLTLASIAT